MKNIYSFLALCGLFSFIAVSPGHAQTNFRPGYVLPLTGDTLRGEVDRRDSRAQAQRCRFRANAQAEVTTYLPAELRGYGFPGEGRHYRARSVAAAPAPAQPYFLEVLIDGPAALYFLRDAAQKEFFYVQSSQLPLTALEYQQVRVVRDGRTFNEEQTPFRTTLATALAGCPAVQGQLPRLPFQESALRRVVSQYNACQGGAGGRLASPAPVSHVVLGLLGGVVQHRLSYEGFPYESRTMVTQHTGFAVGSVLRFGTGRASQKLSVVVALLYEAEKYELESTGSASSTRTRTRFDLAYLRLPVMFRYTYPRGKISPFGEAGLTVAYAIKTDNDIAQPLSNGTYGSSYPLLVGNSFQHLQLGLGAGLGVSTRTAGGRSIALLTRAEVSNGFSGVTGIAASVLHFYGLLSYDLTK